MSSGLTRAATPPAASPPRLAWHFAFAVSLSDQVRSRHAQSGDPVDLVTGRFTVSKTDLVLPGRIPVTLQRSYRSENPVPGVLGIGWNLAPYDSVITQAGSGPSLTLVQGRHPPPLPEDPRPPRRRPRRHRGPQRQRPLHHRARRPPGHVCLRPHRPPHHPQRSHRPHRPLHLRRPEPPGDRHRSRRRRHHLRLRRRPPHPRHHRPPRHPLPDQRVQRPGPGHVPVTPDTIEKQGRELHFVEEHPFIEELTRMLQAHPAAEALEVKGIRLKAVIRSRESYLVDQSGVVGWAVKNPPR